MGEYLCSNCFATLSFVGEMMCLVCNRPALFGKTHPLCATRYTIDGCLASLRYAGVVKKLIYQFKYKPYLSSLGDDLAELFYEGIIQQEQFFRIITPESILVPIPLASSRLRARGYNHAEILADGLGKRLSLPTVTLLRRVKQTTVQAGLKRSERLENMRGAFVLSDQVMDTVNGRHVLLVDDIVTSGATLREAAIVLKRAGAQAVWGMALAHGQ